VSGGLRDGELEGAVEMAAAVRGGQVSVIDLVERSVARAEAWQPSINAFSQMWAEEAVSRARDAAREGPLAGVPLAIKDLFDVAGFETTGCCAAYRGRVATADAPIVSEVVRAGALAVGKTNQHELAAGGTNLVSACGRTGNPWDPSRMTGGSSGGSGAAVAAGIVPIALGSDTGGSIRIPASMCGVFGLKPTHGVLSTQGLMPLAPSMDCPGPMASTMKDLGLLFEAMGGVIAPAASGAHLRLGVPDGFFADRVHTETLGAVASAGSIFEGAGVAIEPVDGTGIENARRVWMAVCSAEFAASYPSLVGERRALVAPQVVEWLEEGESQSDADHTRAALERAEITGWFSDRLAAVDALLLPTTPYPAPRADQRVVALGPAGEVDVGHVGPGWLTCSVNLAGLPAISLPAGRSSDGLPIGVSLVAGSGGEGILFALGRLWEAASGYAPRQPSLPVAGPAA
jgi:Asp-tRNA(Asn)/Glu-tRNA(Gln) amidotransferase A subunit family amidase